MVNMEDAPGYAEEIITSKSAPNSPMKFGVFGIPPREVTEMIKLQSLLMQFIHPQVRCDFLNGEFAGLDASEPLLLDIDHVRRILIPPWRGSSASAMQFTANNSLAHFQSLINRSNSVQS